ncbi:MAG: hypothetical protein HUJ26_04415 [Planctomycetaceae bacterium]|nr:hypothetical protein [Planctomycetaceae bacterium]
MGNMRSGRWRNHQKKMLVEDCLQIDIRDTNDEFLQLAVGNGKVHLRTNSGQPVRESRGQLLPLESGGRLLMFALEFTSGSVWQAIPVLTSTQESDRSETVFECPSDGCDKRARKLYLPLGRTHFLCRDCHKLTYRSQQEHDPRVTRLKKNPDQLLAMMEAIDPADFNFSKVLLLRRAGGELLEEIDKKLPDYSLMELVAAGLLDEQNLKRLAAP